jgi:hypothetical protein
MKQILLMIAVVALVGGCANDDPDPADTKASRAHNSETSTRP